MRLRETLIGAWLFFSPTADAAINLFLNSGASLATVEGTRTSQSQGISLSLQTLYQFEFLGLSLGVEAQQSKFKTVGTDYAKSSTVNFMGPSIGFSTEDKSRLLRILASAYVKRDYTASGENYLTVNGKNYAYAVYESFEGKIPTSVRLDYLKKVASEKLSSDQSMYMGLSLDYLTWQLSKVRSETSNSVENVKPESSDIKVTTDILTIYTAYLVLGLNF